VLSGLFAKAGHVRQREACGSNRRLVAVRHNFSSMIWGSDRFSGGIVGTRAMRPGVYAAKLRVAWIGEVFTLSCMNQRPCIISSTLALPTV